MSGQTQRTLTLFLALGTIVLLSGCIWLAAGAAGVLGRMATDKKVTVTVKSEGEKTSRISIRIGTFGDKDLSQQILNKIKSNL